MEFIMKKRLKIGIIGTGWLGSRIAKFLSESMEVKTSFRSSSNFDNLQKLGFEPFCLDFSDSKMVDFTTVSASFLNNLDAVIITIPFSSRRSSVQQITFLVSNFTSFLSGYTGLIYFMSSTGVYGSVPKLYMETDSEVHDVIEERWLKEFFPQATILRLGGLMGDDRYLSKYSITNLHEAVNHVHYMDVCEILKKLIESECKSELFNVVAPLHPSKLEVVRNQDPLKFTMNFDSKTTESQRIISSEKIQNQFNFVFRYPNPALFPFNKVD